MEAPIYYSFRELREKYVTDFETFRDTWPNATMPDFLHEVSLNYEFWVDADFDTIPCEVLPAYNRNDGCRFKTYSIPIEEYIQVIGEYVLNFANSFNLEDPEKAFDYLVERGTGVCYESFLQISPKQIRPKDPIRIYNFSKRIIRLHKPFFDLQKPLHLFNSWKYQDFLFSLARILNFIENYQIEEESYLKAMPEHLPADKIKLNGNTQVLGYLLNELIERGYIEPIKFTTDKVNKSATALMFLKHFEFTENGDPPSADYLSDAIFKNSLGMDKTDFFSDHLKIPSIKQLNGK